MAIRRIESFDYVNTADLVKAFTQIYTGGGSNAPVIGAYGRRSTQGVRFSAESTVNENAQALGLVVSEASGATCGIFHSFTQTGAFANLSVGTSADPNQDHTSSVTNCLWNIRQGGSNQVSLRINTNGTLSAIRGTTTYTVLGTTVNALQVGTTYAIKSTVVISDTVGVVEVVVNGDQWLALSGQDTMATASATWNEVVIGHLAITGGGAHSWDFDDLVIWDGDDSDTLNPDTDIPTDVRVDYRLVTADGASQTFTPSAGTDHYALLDEVPASTSDYIGSSTPGARDTFEGESVALPGAGVIAVEVVYLAQRMEAGTSSTSAVLRLGTSYYAGTAEGNASSDTYQRTLWGRRPSDEGAWTESDFDNAQRGVQKST